MDKLAEEEVEANDFEYILKYLGMQVTIARLGHMSLRTAPEYILAGKWHRACEMYGSVESLLHHRCSTYV